LARIARWLPAASAAMLPTLFIPVSVDAYVLPRVSLTLAGGGVLAAAGLVAGRRSLGALRWPALAAAGAAILAASLSVAPAVSVAGAYGRYESLPVRLAYLGLFGGAAWLGERRRTVAGFLLGCGVASIETLYQAVTHALPRPDGNLGNANLLGALLAMALPLAADRARGATPAARRGWAALGALLAAALVASTSRSGWLGAVLGLGVLAAFAAPRRRLWLVVAAGAAALAVAAGAIALTPLRDLNGDSGGARPVVWHDALAVVAERPLAGWGEDTMGLVFGRHQTGDWAPGHNFDRAHSLPLDLAASQGVVGLAAGAWLFGAWWLVVWRRRAEPCVAGVAGAAAAYLVWALVNFDWAPATAAFWLLAGTVAGRPPLPTPENPHPATAIFRGPRVRAVDGPPPPRGGRGFIALALGLLGLAAAVPAQAADVYYYLGQPGRASALDPLQPAYWAARGDLAGLQRAAALGDPNPSTYVALGDAEARAGDQAAATAAYRRALTLYPYDPAALQRLSARRRAASG
jgi:O-antigen ligase